MSKIQSESNSNNLTIDMWFSGNFANLNHENNMNADLGKCSGLIIKIYIPGNDLSFNPFLFPIVTPGVEFFN